MIDLESKRILVTGGAGFLGTAIVKRLVDEGAAGDNIVVPRSESLDLRIRENCETAVKGIDIVIHAAGKGGGIGFNQKHPGSIFFDNILMGAQLMEAARLEGVRKFITIGTVCSYPKNAPVPFREEDLWNGYPEPTNGPYGLSKKMLLVQGEAYRHEYSFNSIHLLVVNLFGPGDDFDDERSHVIPALIKKIIKAKESHAERIVLWGTGSPTREFLYVQDAAEGIVKATKFYDKMEPVNLGSGQEITIANLASTIAQLLGYNGEIMWDSSKPDGQSKRMLDVSRAEREFHFKASTSFERGLRNTIDWYLDTYHKPENK